MSTVQKVAAWFSPERRQTIQVFFGSLVPIMIMTGLATEGSAAQLLIITGAVMQFAASSLSLVNVSGVAGVWMVLRTAIYTAAMTVAPAFIVLGVIDETTGATVLTGVSIGLTTLSSLLAVFVGKDQQADIAVEAAYVEGVQIAVRDSGPE